MFLAVVVINRVAFAADLVRVLRQIESQIQLPRRSSVTPLVTQKRRLQLFLNGLRTKLGLICFQALEEATLAHAEHFLDGVTEFVIALDVIQVLVDAVQLLHEQHGVEAPAAVVLEHVEDDVLPEGRSEVLPVQVGLRVSLDLQSLGVLRFEVQMVQELVEALRELVVVDEVHGVPRYDRSDVLEINEFVHMIQGFPHDVVALNNINDNFGHRDKEVHVLFPAVEILDAVHIIWSCVEILAEQLIDLSLKPVLLSVELLLALLMELDHLHLHVLPVDFVWYLLIILKLRFHFNLVKLLDLGDVRPLYFLLFDSLIVRPHRFGEVEIKACRILDLDERQLIVLAHPDNFNVVEVVFVFLLILRLLYLPLDFDGARLSELLEGRIEWTEPLHDLKFPELNHHLWDVDRLQNALGLDVLEEPLALVPARFFLDFVLEPGPLLVKEAVLNEVGMDVELLLYLLIEDVVHIDVVDLDQQVAELLLGVRETYQVNVLGSTCRLDVGRVEVAAHLAVDFAKSLEVHLIVEAGVL